MKLIRGNFNAEFIWRRINRDSEHFMYYFVDWMTLSIVEPYSVEWWMVSG